MLSRRNLLAAGVAGGAALLARGAGAIGDASRFRIGQLRLPSSRWNPHPNALRRMLWELDKRTSIDVDLEPAVVTLDSPRLHETPFLYLAGDDRFALPGSTAIESLRRYLTFGGFLLVDSAEGRTGGAFDHSVRQLLGAVFPAPAPGLTILAKDHVLYKSFYLIDRPVGRLATSPIMEALIRDDRVTVAYSQNDLAGAWARDDLGNYLLRCEPGGERQRERSFRLGINIVMYALCLEYKADQVHVPFILKRRRWRIDP